MTGLKLPLWAKNGKSFTLVRGKSDAEVWMPAWQNRYVTSTWRKSRHSSSTSNCVEIACDESLVLVRDSRNQSDVMLSFDPGQWSAFLGTVRDIG